MSVTFPHVLPVFNLTSPPILLSHALLSRCPADGWWALVNWEYAESEYAARVLTSSDSSDSDDSDDSEGDKK